jgi:3-hydroxyisobutyrate dehydrogenase-like beta-hydroxyacid dehydrogenase
MEVGVIGLGRMGGAMARNLAKAGHRVRAWNRSPLAGTLPVGMEIVSCPAEALQADAAFTMLSDDSVIRDVLLSSGALESARSRLAHVVTSTISVGFAGELRALHDAAGIGYVSAPVFGRPEAAEAAQLEVMAAGDKDAVAKVRPLLDVIGRRTWVLGEDPKQAYAARSPAT